MKNKHILPVLFGFFIMGFCDVVGISTSYVQADFGLSEAIAGLLPSAVFIWFLLLGIPTALVMNKIGRKSSVIIGNIITLIGVLAPFVTYSFASVIIGFALLGIGNTILQVSLNPLLSNIVKEEALSSSLTAGQVVKAISSFCGPIIALVATTQLGNWQYIFPIFGLITTLSTFWLIATPIKEHKSMHSSNLGEALSLLGNKSILICFLGIMAIVGLDVGINTVTPKLLIERVGLSVEQAGLGSSVYFVSRTCGAFLGAFLLTRINDIRYFRWNIVAVIGSMALLFFAQVDYYILIAVGGIGFFASSIFSVILSLAIKKLPTKANEISGLMITGVCGGAIIPPLMGYAADSMGSQLGSLLVISICILYLFICSMRMKSNN
ncbi:MAG: MFS transporter [Phocaeicola sp.]